MDIKPYISYLRASLEGHAQDSLTQSFRLVCCCLDLSESTMADQDFELFEDAAAINRLTGELVEKLDAFRIKLRERAYDPQAPRRPPMRR